VLAAKRTTASLYMFRLEFVVQLCSTFVGSSAASLSAPPCEHSCRLDQMRSHLAGDTARDSRARTRSPSGLRELQAAEMQREAAAAQINKGKGNDKPVDRPVRCPDPEPCGHAALAAAAAQSCGGQSAEQTSDVSQLAGDSAPKTGGTLFGTSLFTFLPDDAVPCFSQANNAEVWQQFTVPHDLHERLSDIAGALSWHNALSQLLQTVGHQDPPQYFSASIDASLRLELLTLRQAKWLRHLNARANSAKHNLCFSV